MAHVSGVSGCRPWRNRLSYLCSARTTQELTKRTQGQCGFTTLYQLLSTTYLSIAAAERSPVRSAQCGRLVRAGMIGAANSRAASWVPASGFKTAVRSKLADLCRLFSLASTFQEGWEPAGAKFDSGGLLPDGSPNVAASTTKNKVPPVTRASAAANRLTGNWGAIGAVLMVGVLHPRPGNLIGKAGDPPHCAPLP